MTSPSEDDIRKMLISYRMGDMWGPEISVKEALLTEIEHFVDCIAMGARRDGRRKRIARRQDCSKPPHCPCISRAILSSLTEVRLHDPVLLTCRRNTGRSAPSSKRRC